jgi:DNA-binding NarL/FixJ family response regulator
MPTRTCRPAHDFTFQYRAHCCARLGDTAQLSMMEDSSRPTTVGIVEDEPGVRAGWVRILNTIPGYRCVTDIGSGEEALVELPKTSPAIVLMDIHLPGISGVQCTRQLKQLLPKVEVLMLTMFGDRNLIFDALRAGASGYLLKRTTPAALQAALAEAKAGGAPMSPQIARKVVEFFAHNHSATLPETAANELSGLSMQESETLHLLAKGYQYKQIAGALGISLDTVRTYIRRIYRKLHVHSRTEAIVKHLEARQR